MRILAAAGGRLHELDQREVGEAELLRVRAGLLGRVKCVPVTAESVVQDGAGVQREAQPHAFAPRGHAIQGGPDQPGGLVFVALPGGQRQGAVGRQVGARRLGDGLALLDQR
ncbi:MAG TPA: hypothetical protein VJ305_23735, partial [Streptosporangiaceae bacterium]|nr:hypothetical protein [Streptosporangiaceae bacterium]